MGIGFLEIVIIGVAALVFLGPERLPEIMRNIAKFYVQIRRTSNDFKSAFDHVVHEAEAEFRKENLNKLQKMLHEIPAEIKSGLGESSSETNPAPRMQVTPAWEPAEVTAPDSKIVQESPPEATPSASETKA